MPFPLAAIPLAGKVAMAAVKTLAPAAAKAATASAAENPKLRKVANDFESMFLEQMVDRMTQSADTEGPLGENGTGGGVWRSMLSNEYAKSISKAGGVGISDQIMHSLVQLQAGANKGGA